MSTEDNSKIQKFNGRHSDDYHLWRLRCEIALKGKGYWSQLQGKDFDQDVKDKSSAIMVAALGDTALRVCSAKIGEPLQMLDLLDKRFASNRTATRISVLTAMFSKRFCAKDDMPKYIDEFETLFAQLERMGPETKISESHKAPLLLASMGNSSPLESTFAALRTRDTDQLSWEAVSADLIQEWSALKSSSNGKESNSDRTKNGGGNRRRQFSGNAKKRKNIPKFDYCGMEGHTEEKCFSSPESSNCKLPQHTKEKIKAMKAKSGEKEKQSSLQSSEYHHFGGLIRTRKLHHANFSSTNRNISILDSGASISMFRESSEADNGTYLAGSDDVVELAAGSTPSECLGTGSLSIVNISLKGSLHVDHLNGTLISVGHICDQGNTVVFTKDDAVILNLTKFSVRDNDIIEVIPRNKHSRLYESDRISSSTAMSAKQSADINIWHQRLVHTNQKVLKQLHRTASNFPDLKGHLRSCHPCHM